MKSAIRKLVLLAGVVLTTTAWGQNASVTVGSGAELPGVTGVTIPVTLTAGDDIAGIDMTVTLTTAANYTNIAVNCGAANVSPNLFASCSVNSNVVTISMADTQATTWVDGLLANITFDVAGDATPTMNDPLVANVVGAGDTTGSDLDPLPSSTDGTFTVSAGPQPVFGSAPTAATGVSMSGEISTTIQSNVIIENNAGEDGSTLNYTCTESADPSGKFTISGDITNIDVAKGSDATVTVACDSSEVESYTGEMSCAHNGSNATPAVFALSCTVNAGPEPAFTGTPSGLNMVAEEEGDANPTGSLTITNTGAATTTLSGTCSLSGDTEISLTGGAFSVDQGAAGAVLPVACDASSQGFFGATLSCAHNGTNVATPVDYDVTCDVGPPGAAVYSSVPVPGSTIDMTPEPVPSGTPVADQFLTITNAAPEANDSDLTLFNCGFAGDPEITATAPGTPLAPMESTQVTFGCDSTEVGDYTGTYSCEYNDGSQPQMDAAGGAFPIASYTVDCSVRAAESAVDSTPAPDSTLNISVPANGTGFTYINIFEVNDEGVDAEITSCELADGSNFAILNNFPMTVPAGGSIQIQIEGTDPGNGGLTFEDMISCYGTDSSGEISADWYLQLNVQTAAIPTLSPLGLLAMILTMFGFGSIIIRRKIGS